MPAMNNLQQQSWQYSDSSNSSSSPQVLSNRPIYIFNTPPTSLEHQEQGKEAFGYWQRTMNI
jgi:hypothetical protein